MKSRKKLKSGAELNATRKPPAPTARVIEFAELRRMLPQQLDGLPGPADFGGKRKMWVGIGWVDEGPARGDEPLYVIDTAGGMPAPEKVSPA